MRNLLALFAAAILTFAAFGWYLGWYTIETPPAPAGHRAVNIDIDSKKIGEDLHKGGARLQEAIDKSRQAENSKPGEITKADNAKSDPTKQSPDPY